MDSIGIAEVLRKTWLIPRLKNKGNVPAFHGDCICRLNGKLPFHFNTDLAGSGLNPDLNVFLLNNCVHVKQTEASGDIEIV